MAEKAERHSVEKVNRLRVRPVGVWVMMMGSEGHHPTGQEVRGQTGWSWKITTKIIINHLLVRNDRNPVHFRKPCKKIVIPIH